LVRIRSTVPAEIVFSPQSLVDARLNVEFFKHLPGILTGIGIIGSFYGLINGIQHFDPSLLAKAKTDPAQMNKLFVGLKVLFDEVQGAFIASFFAIGTAMLITVLEKDLLNVCYRKLEQLCQILDELYEGGVGEDYLASLVKSSAESATQTAQLKQSLVTELSELLRDLNAQQIKQSEVLGNLLSAKIQEHIGANEDHGERFRTELKEGLADIGKTVAGVTDGQGDTMTCMLEHLIHSFSANIQSTFGDQMKGQAEMMNMVIASMAEMHTGFKTLLQDLRESGKLEREDLTTKVTSLVGTLEAQQGKLESQMTAFIEAIQNQIGTSQQETMAQVKESLQEIQVSIGKILTDMEKERRATVDTERDLHRQFTDTSNQLVLDMDKHIRNLVEEIGKTVVAIS
jgi:putative membrane protein